MQIIEVEGMSADHCTTTTAEVLNFPGQFWQFIK